MSLVPVAYDFMQHQFIKIVSDLKEDSQPLWGSMNAHQLCEHLSLAVKISNGSLLLDFPPLTGKEERYKQKLFGLDKISKGLNAFGVKPGEAFPTRFKDFNAAYNRLIFEHELFIKFFEENPEATLRQPLVGNLNKDEWYLFHFKHYLHHLEQFELLKQDDYLK